MQRNYSLTFYVIIGLLDSQWNSDGRELTRLPN